MVNDRPDDQRRDCTMERHLPGELSSYRRLRRRGFIYFGFCMSVNGAFRSRNSCILL
jgi:hypothetical protein